MMELKMAVEVHQFPCLNDNYGFLLHDTESGMTACIDTPEVEPINAALADKGWSLTHIFNTHHHFDHACGNETIKTNGNARSTAQPWIRREFLVSTDS